MVSYLAIKIWPFYGPGHWGGYLCPKTVKILARKGLMFRNLILFSSSETMKYMIFWKCYLNDSPHSLDIIFSLRASCSKKKLFLKIKTHTRFFTWYYSQSHIISINLIKLIFTYVNNYQSTIYSQITGYKTYLRCSGLHNSFTWDCVINS